MEDLKHVFELEGEGQHDVELVEEDKHDVEEVENGKPQKNHGDIEGLADVFDDNLSGDYKMNDGEGSDGSNNVDGKLDEFNYVKFTHSSLFLAFKIIFDL